MVDIRISFKFSVSIDEICNDCSTSFFLKRMAGLVFTGFVGFLIWGLDGIGKVGIELGIYCHQN